jgi:HSP20 family protein
VKAEIPGVRKEDIDVSIDGNRVSITAEVKREKEERKGETVVCSERYYGTQFRGFTLQHAVDQSKTDAKYENGVLELTLPKRQPMSAKQVSVR